MKTRQWNLVVLVVLGVSLVGYATSNGGGNDAVSRSTQAAVRWEYKVVVLPFDDRDAQQKKLNELGVDGWELVTAHGVGAQLHEVILKRPHQ